MNRPQVNLKDILGERPPCYFSSKGENPFRYSDECRNCLETKHYYTCDNYLPSHSPGKTVLSKANNGSLFTSQDVIKRNEEQIRRNEEILRPFFWYHQSLKVPTLPKSKAMGIIRNWNDSTSC